MRHWCERLESVTAMEKARKGFSQGEVWGPEYPQGRVCFLFVCHLRERSVLPPFEGPYDLHHQKWLLLPGEKTILPSTKPGCLAGTFLRGNAQLLSTALSFSLQPASWGGGQLGGSHIEKLGGPGQPFGLGQGARLWPRPGHSIECRNEQRKSALWHVPLSRS